MENYSVKKIGKADFHLLIPLMKDCFGMDVNIGYFEWKYTQNPSGDFVGFIALSPENEVAAYYGVIPETYTIENIEKIIYQSCDTMTHSRHRRKGLFQLLAKHCYSYLKEMNQLYIIGFGGGQSTPGFIKFGWKEFFSVKNYFYLNSFALRFRLSLYSKEKLKKVIKINDLSVITDLLANSNNKSAIASKKDEKLYNWRISNPLNEYEIYAIKGTGEKYTGYLTFYRTEKDLFLFDLFGHTKMDQMILLNWLKLKMIKEKRRAIVTMCQVNSSFSKVLKQNYFIVNPFKKGPLSTITPFIFYAEESTMKEYSDSSKWNVTPYEHDSL